MGKFIVRIFLDHKIDHKIAAYTFTEIFRYIDSEFEFVTNQNDADIIYGAHDEFIVKSKIYLKADMQFWENYKKQNSLPQSPLKKINDIVYPYDKDIIASTFFLLSGYEEYLNLKRDKYQRFLFEFSFYKKDQIYTKPMVEKYRDYTITLLNQIGILCVRKNIWSNKEYALFLSHDVDGIYKYRNSIKSLAKIFLKPSKFTFIEFLKSKYNQRNDPYFLGFDYLMEESKKYGFKSTFFFISKIREKLDDFYNITDQAIVDTMEKIKFNKFEVGLHATIASYKNRLFLKEEKNLFNFTIDGIRQHYLMNNICETAQYQNKLFQYDSTLGFVDMIGFRRGTCLPFQLYDIDKEAPLELYEIPLNAMDVTLKQYMKLSEDTSYVLLQNMATEIKKYNGIFSFLWHPGNCSDEWSTWLSKVYEPILKELHQSNVESLTGIEILKKMQLS